MIAILTKTEKPPSLKKLKGWAKILGIISAAGGAITITLAKKQHGHDKNSDKTSTDLLIGCLFILAHTIITGVYVVIQKKFIFNKSDCNWKKYPVTLTAWTFLFESSAMSLATLYYVCTPWQYTNVPIQTIYPLIYAVFLGSAMPYLLLSWCNMQINPSTVTASWPLHTLFCIIISYFVLGEVMQPLQYLGGGLTIFGLLSVIWANYQEERNEMETLQTDTLLEEDFDKQQLVDTD